MGIYESRVKCHEAILAIEDWVTVTLTGKVILVVTVHQRVSASEPIVPNVHISAVLTVHDPWSVIGELTGQTDRHAPPVCCSALTSPPPVQGPALLVVRPLTVLRVPALDDNATSAEEEIKKKTLVPGETTWFSGPYQVRVILVLASVFSSCRKHLGLSESPLPLKRCEFKAWRPGQAPNPCPSWLFAEPERRMMGYVS